MPDRTKERTLNVLPQIYTCSRNGEVSAFQCRRFTEQSGGPLPAPFLKWWQYCLFWTHTSVQIDGRTVSVTSKRQRRRLLLGNSRKHVIVINIILFFMWKQAQFFKPIFHILKTGSSLMRSPCSVSVCVTPIIARQRLSNLVLAARNTKIEELLEAYFLYVAWRVVPGDVTHNRLPVVLSLLSQNRMLSV
jgi:hypothetical protein